MTAKTKTQTIKITASMQRADYPVPPFRTHIMRLVTLMLACGGSVLSVLTCVDTGISNLKMLAVIFAACLLTLLFGVKKPFADYAFGACSVVLIGAVYALRDEFSAGLANFLNIYKAIHRKEFREKPFIAISQPELSQEHLEIFLVIAAILLCYLAGMLVIRNDLHFLGIFLTFLPLMAVLAIGLEPHPAAFIAFASGAAAGIAGEWADVRHGNRFAMYTAQCTITAAAITALLLSMVFGFTRAIGYKRPQKLENLYTEICDYMQSGQLEKTVDKVVAQIVHSHKSGAINHGKLDGFENIYFNYETVLQATLPRTEDTVYLRGFVGSVYTGNSWEELPNGRLAELKRITDNFTNTGMSTLLLDSYSLKQSPGVLPNYGFTAKNIAASDDYLYMPYGIVPESVSRYEIVDESHFRGGEDTYFGQVYKPDGYYGYQNIFRSRWSVPAALLADEAAYRNFVYENYLELPESFDPTPIFNESYHSYITAEVTMTGKSTLDEMTVFSRKLYYIKNWLRDNCRYTLVTKPMAKGGDFINHFLDTKEGSCSHFASTAVMMCRYAGIPARYVEGYVIKPSDYPEGTAVGAVATVDVLDTRGHAWVEIYIDGYGWYPMEFTSGYGNVRTAEPTETTVTETEETTSMTEPETVETAAETEITDENGFPVSIPLPMDGDENSAGTAHTTAVQEEAEPTVTTVPTTSVSSPTETEDNGMSIGFGIFGIQGDRKVDLWIDLTWLLWLALGIGAAILLIMLRRWLIIANRRSLTSPEERIMAEYRRFLKLTELMSMPRQGELTYREYGELLAERSPVMADGNAASVISAALKASFGGGVATRDDSHEMQLTVTSMVKRYYGTCSAWKRLLLKFGYCII